MILSFGISIYIAAGIFHENISTIMGLKYSFLSAIIISFASSIFISYFSSVRTAEASERLSEQLNMSISELSVVIFDSEGHLDLINKRAMSFIALPESDIDYYLFASTFDIDITLEELVYVESSHNRNRTAHKGERFFDMEFVVSFEGQERANNIIIVIRDCTEQRKLEEMRKDFIANVSHELKTPLTSISSYTEALIDGAVTDPELSNNFLSVISSEAGRMARLVRDLLQMSQIDRQAFPLTKRRQSFENAVKSCVEKVSIDAENHGLEVENYVIGEIPEVYMDADRIEQVLLNVLSNAIKYTPEKGKISIYIGVAFSQVYAKISDTGIGIPRDSLDRVFERFYRVDKARTREQGGTGLGLAISREIIQAHGGEITITSEFGVGTEVTIKLPIQSNMRKAF
jgi:two-component system sensor histidine kinase VicK